MPWPPCIHAVTNPGYRVGRTEHRIARKHAMAGPQQPYRILCLDGGGRWSLISVMALQSVFGARAKGHDILQGFDLVAANSGGSIVLGGLVENKSLAELIDLFCTSG